MTCKAPGKNHPCFWACPWPWLPGSHNGGQFSRPLSLLGGCRIGVLNKCASWWKAGTHAWWVVFPWWVESHTANGLSCWSSKCCEGHQSRSHGAWPLYRLLVGQMQEMHIRHLLWQVDSWTSARFPAAKIICARGNWSCWPPLYYFAEVSLWVKLRQILLGCHQEIPLWQLWLHIWHFEGEYAKSLGVHAVANNPVVGTPDVSMDGCLQGRYGHDRCSEIGEEVQLHEVQIAQTYSGEHHSHFQPVITNFWCLCHNWY